MTDTPLSDDVVERCVKALLGVPIMCGTYGLDEDDAEALAGAALEAARYGDELRDAVIAAYIAGATDVHNNWREDRDPDFTEAAHDYASSALLSSIGASQP